MTDGRIFEAFEVFEAALTVGRHWNDQEGVNSALLDELAETVASYDAVRVGLPRVEPPSVAALRQALRVWQRKGVCPSVAAAQHACVWTCRECDESRPPTVTSGPGGGERLPVRCALLVHGRQEDR